MQLSDFHYDIPEELIATEPPKIRGEARLLVLNRATGALTDATYPDVTKYLNPGDVLVINNTKVLKARLMTHKDSGASRELVLVEKHGKTDNWHTHKVVYRGRIKPGDTLTVSGADSQKLKVVEVLDGGLAIIESSTDLLEIAEKYGSVPLPPYMRRESTPEDIERYQTVFAQEVGSVAAPTASLNMTESTLVALKAKGVEVVYATLHVGLGTFLPIRVDDVTDHKMHQEYFEVPPQTAAAIRQAKLNGNRVVALGTTITRTLEYAHEQIMDPKNDQIISGEADIFIYPGYKFNVIDGLLTNFHMPESTVLMLTAAFAGWDNLHPAYLHAVKQKYKFFSYGDSMLILDLEKNHA